MNWPSVLTFSMMWQCHSFTIIQAAAMTHISLVGEGLCFTSRVASMISLKRPFPTARASCKTECKLYFYGWILYYLSNMFNIHSVFFFILIFHLPIFLHPVLASCSCYMHSYDNLHFCIGRESAQHVTFIFSFSNNQLKLIYYRPASSDQVSHKTHQSLQVGLAQFYTNMLEKV